MVQEAAIRAGYSNRFNPYLHRQRRTCFSNPSGCNGCCCCGSSYCSCSTSSGYGSPDACDPNLPYGAPPASSGLPSCNCNFNSPSYYYCNGVCYALGGSCDNNLPCCGGAAICGTANTGNGPAANTCCVPPGGSCNYGTDCCSSSFCSSGTCTCNSPNCAYCLSGGSACNPNGGTPCCGICHYNAGGLNDGCDPRDNNFAGPGYFCCPD